MTTTPTNAAGAFKVVYGDMIADLTPEADVFHKDFKFVEPNKREGSEYRHPVQVTRETGFTLDNTGNAFDLLGSNSRSIPEATINGATYVGQSAMSYDAMARALAVGQTRGARAFINMTKDTVENMVKTATHVAEVMFRYGMGSSFSADATGAIDALAEVSSNSASGTSATVTLTEASWATAIWVGNEGLRLDCYDSDGTQRNSNAVIELTSVDPENYQITVSGNSTDLGNIVAGDYFVYRSSWEKQMTGLGRILKNTGSLFGISASTYNLWKGSTYSVSGPLTFGKLLQAANRTSDLGYRGDLCAYINPAAWTDLMEDEAALVRHADAAKSEYSRGSNNIKFFCQTGTLEVKPDIYMKRGFGFMLPKDKVLRLGASEFTFEMPTGDNRRLMRELDAKAGTELRGYWNQAIFMPTPALGTILTGITPSSPAA